MILRYWFIFIYDKNNYKKTIKITFSIKKFNMITIFSLMNFICFFLLQKLNNFVGFKTPVVERWLIHMKRLVTALDFLVLSSVLFIIDRTTARSAEEIIRWLATEVWQYFHNNIYVSGPILVKLANEFNLSCLYSIFVKKKVFQIEHMKLKGPPSS